MARATFPIRQALLALGLGEAEALSLAVALERASGRASAWHPYLRSIPKAEPLPLVWPRAALQLLRGTGLDVAARRRRRHLAETHRSLQRVWAGAPTAPPATRSHAYAPLPRRSACRRRVGAAVARRAALRHDHHEQA